MKNISFHLTTAQIRQSIENVRAGLKPVKDVTRRLGWKDAKVGDRLQACVKCQGLKPGERLEKLCVIEVTSVKQEPLLRLIQFKRYGFTEVRREGFSGLSTREFVAMFCKHMGCERNQTVTRLEFSYVII